MLAWTHRRMPELYLALALVLTSLLSILTAPFFTPDEPNHAARAISIAHGAWMAHMGATEAGADIDQGALQAMDGVNDIRKQWEQANRDFQDRSAGTIAEKDQRALANIRWTHRSVFVPFDNTATYPPTLYLPAVAGWLIGQALNLTIFHSLQLARLLCAWTAVLVGWLALRLCACSRWILLPLLLLPSTLFLNASCSQDAVMLTAAALVAALLTRPLVARREWTRSELAAITGVLALCAMARPPYLALAFVLFLPAVEMNRGGWRRWAAPLAAFLAVTALCAGWRSLVAPFGLDNSDQANPDDQTAFLLAHPFAAALAVLRGTLEAGDDFVHRGLYVVGWNDLLPHHGAEAVLAVCLLAMLLFAPACPLRTWRGRLVLASAIAAPLLGISLAEYVIWTPPGFHTVYGIQPRYWLPVLPLAAMLLQGRIRLLLALRLRTPFLLSATAIFTLTACTLPWMVAHAFYREGVWRILQLNLR